MNATRRARWILALAVAGAVAGLLGAQEPLALAGLATLGWLALEAFNFWIRTSLSAADWLQVERLLGAHSRRAYVLAVGQEIEVRLRLRWAARLRGLHVRIEEVLPSVVEVAEGDASLMIEAWREDAGQWSYTLRAVATGQATLPGLAVIVSDAHGLFQTQHFLRLPAELTVLPFLVRPKSTVSVLKQQNVQMMTGTHRFRQPGFSPELLEIRDYQPGDSPRSIAWKATARLDRLMTCEFESETPIRATIFTDLSAPLYTGEARHAPAQRVIQATAGIARFLLADGDPVAAMIATGQDSRRSWIPHGAGERHLSRLLLRLVAIQPQPSFDELYVDTLLSLTWHAAYRRFPSLFDPAVNRPPVPWYYFAERQRRTYRRRQLSLVLTQLYGAPTELAVRLEHDHALFVDYCRRLLQEHPGLVELPTVSLDATRSRRLQAATQAQMTQGLLSAVARARDNELFVIVGSIPHDRTDLNRLIHTVRVARGANHRVVMIDVGPPPHQHYADSVARQAMNESLEVVHQQRFAELKVQLIGLGGRLGRLEENTLLEKVASEIEILRTGRARV